MTVWIYSFVAELILINVPCCHERVSPLWRPLLQYGYSYRASCARPS